MEDQIETKIIILKNLLVNFKKNPNRKFLRNTISDKQELLKQPTTK